MAHCQDFALEEKGPRNKLEEGRGRKKRESKAPCSVDLEPLLFGAAANHPTSPFSASFSFFSVLFHFARSLLIPRMLLWKMEGRGETDMVIHCHQQKGGNWS